MFPVYIAWELTILCTLNMTTHNPYKEWSSALARLDLEGEIDQTRLRSRNGAAPVISAKGSIVAAGKQHHCPAKVPKGPTDSHAGRIQ